MRHFGDLMLVRRPDGRLDWLRWYDPAVLVGAVALPWP